MKKLLPLVFVVASLVHAGPMGTGTISGVFANPSPACVARPDTDPTPGAECSGIGTNSFAWGDSVPFGGGPNTFQFNGNAFTNQPLGVDFVAGLLFYHNGTIVVASTVNSVDLDLTSTGDSTPFNQSLTVPITIVQTPNIFPTPAENADYIYFTDHPEFGSFRVYEGAGTTVEVIAKFNSLDLVGFGAVGDSSAGFVNGTITAIPEPTTLVLSGTALFGLAIALRRLRTRP
jgi:hypothetical protein